MKLLDGSLLLLSVGQMMRAACAGGSAPKMTGADRAWSAPPRVLLRAVRAYGRTDAGARQALRRRLGLAWNVLARASTDGFADLHVHDLSLNCAFGGLN